MVIIKSIYLNLTYFFLFSLDINVETHGLLFDKNGFNKKHCSSVCFKELFITKRLYINVTDHNLYTQDTHQILFP